MSDKSFLRVKSLILAVSVLLGIILLQGLLQYIFDGTCKTILGISFRENSLLTVAFYVFYSVICTLMFGLLYKKIKKDSFIVHFKSSYRRIAGLILFGIALQGVAYGALNVIFFLFSDNEVLNSYSSMIKNLNGSITPFIFLYTMFFAPVVEETVFRGVIFEGSCEGFGIVGANIIQALCFGVFHGNIVQGIYAFVLGMLLGYIMSQRHSLKETIFVHIIINCAGIFIVPILASRIAQASGLLIAYVIVLCLAVVGCTVWFIIQHLIYNEEPVL